ncbi:MAG: sporulation protein YabP [Defluviitaleaceae bacterium]|nr:sporulation protein YabP [Defluviitaleaceae bacterium]
MSEKLSEKMTINDEKRRENSRHKITMERRESICITGVLDVFSFDENGVICESDLGTLIIKGENLHINNLNLDNGELDIFGEIQSIVYQDGGRKGNKNSFFGRIFK